MWLLPLVFSIAASLLYTDMGKTLLYSTLLAIPTMILVCPQSNAYFLKGIDKPVLEWLYNPKTFY